MVKIYAQPHNNLSDRRAIISNAYTVTQDSNNQV